MPINIITPGHTQIDELANPYYLADRIPGFSQSMDAIKEMREGYDPGSIKITDGIKHAVSLPYPIWMALTACFPNQEEFHTHILPRICQLHPEYRVAP